MPVVRQGPLSEAHRARRDLRLGGDDPAVGRACRRGCQSLGDAAGWTHPVREQCGPSPPRRQEPPTWRLAVKSTPAIRWSARRLAASSHPAGRLAPSGRPMKRRARSQLPRWGARTYRPRR